MPHPDATDGIVLRYLKELEHALRSLPPERRTDILADVRDHIAEARREIAPDDARGVRDLLARIGRPAAIAREAGVEAPTAPSWQDALVPWLLLLGGFVLGIGWVVGLVWLWSSDAWSLRDKLLGTTVWPGGLMAVVLSGGLAVGVGAGVAQVGSAPAPSASPWGLPLALVLIVSPIVVAVHLERMRRRVHTVPHSA